MPTFLVPCLLVIEASSEAMANVLAIEHQAGDAPRAVRVLIDEVLPGPVQVPDDTYPASVLHIPGAQEAAIQYMLEN